MNKKLISLLLIISILGFASCSIFDKIGKKTMIGGLIGCASGLALGTAADELVRKRENKKDFKDAIFGAFKKKKANNNGKMVGLAAGCAIGLGVGLYFDLMKDDVVKDLEAKSIGVAEKRGSDGDIEQLNLQLGEKAIKFEPGQATVPESGKVALNQVAETIKAYPDTKINISGHTDSTGDVNGNRSLSQARANAVRTYLSKEAGLSDEQIGETKGVGPDSPVPGAKPTDPVNRRVELAITAG